MGDLDKQQTLEDSQRMDRDKLLCGAERKASLDCSIKYGDDKKEKCHKFFEAYKECKKEETRLRLLNNNGGKKAGFFPWQ